MWIKRHWPTIAGFAISFAVPIIKGVKQLVGLGGDADFVISRTSDPGWVGRMMEWLLDPPGWATIPMMIIGLALIYWDSVRARRRMQLIASPSLSRETRVSAPMAVGHKAERKPLEADVQTPVLPHPSSAELLPGWERLYELTATGFVRLRFLPDSQKVRDDSLLLIVFGYAILRDIEEVSIGIAHSEVRRALGEAPAHLAKGSILRGAYITQALMDTDHGAFLVIYGLLERVRLAQGGYYRLTPSGQAQAKALAGDLIRRA